ncbi:MAG: glycosyltransferase [Gammaproteobacteria bacterium]|nr:glycosyltransferase [Gammaproteobacteria bacterium]
MIAPTEKTGIFLVRNSVIVGGVETTLIGWLKHMNQSRFEPVLFCFEQAGQSHQPFMQYLSRHGLQARLLPWGKTKNLPAAVMQLVRQIKAYPGKNCIIHTQDVRADLVGWLAARSTATPLMSSNHGWHSIGNGMGFKLQMAEALRAKLLQRFEKLIEVCESTRQESIKRGIDPKKTITIQTGIDLDAAQNIRQDQRDNIRADLGIQPNQIIIGNLARLYPEKGQKHLLDTVPKVLQACPDARFWIVGDGPLLTQLQRQASSLGIEKQTRFMPFQDDFRRVTAALDIFALPSLAKGAPMVIYEAMALALPIITTDVADNAETLEHEKSALLVQPGDTQGLANAILRLATDTNLRAKLGQTAHQTLLSQDKFTVQTSTRRLEQEYLNLLQPEPAA